MSKFIEPPWNKSMSTILTRTQEDWDKIFSHGAGERLAEWQAAHPLPIPKINRYFITLTRNPKICTKPEWFQEVLKLLNQKVHTFESATIEHLDGNIHCHAVLQSKYNLDVTRYTKFFSRHPGCKSANRIKKITWDNGTSPYMNKENPPFNDLSEFTNSYLKLIQ